MSEYCLCDWMNQLNKEIESKSINEIIIPGSHDANTYTISKINALAPFAKCQHKTIFEQLCMGVRFFDLRVGQYLPNELKLIMNKDIEEGEIQISIDASKNNENKKEGRLKFKYTEPEKSLQNFRKTSLISTKNKKIKKTQNINWEMDFTDIADDYSQIADDIKSKGIIINFVYKLKIILDLVFGMNQ